MGLSKQEALCQDVECKLCGQNTFKQRSWGHIVAIEHAFSVLNNCFNEQQLNSLEDYMYIQASVICNIIRIFRIYF